MNSQLTKTGNQIASQKYMTIKASINFVCINHNLVKLKNHCNFFFHISYSVVLTIHLFMLNWLIKKMWSTKKNEICPRMDSIECQVLSIFWCVGSAWKPGNHYFNYIVDNLHYIYKHFIENKHSDLPLWALDINTDNYGRMQKIAK